MDKITNRSWLRIAVAALSALLACMLVLNHARSEALSAARDRITAVYQKAFYETCELTEGIAGNYRKLLVAGDDLQRQMLLGDIARQSQGAASNLALLPLGEETVSATIKFINQAEDFARSLSTKIAAGREITAEDSAAMQQLADGAAAFSLGLEGLLERYERGEAAFSAGDFEPTGDESLYPLSSAAGTYPVLLYDGPFSDGEAVGDFAMIASALEISREQAEARLRAFIPVDEIAYTGNSHPRLDVYEFSLRSGDYHISAGVTRLGGEILYLLPENGEDEILLTEDQLMQTAAAFLLSRGYGAMEMSYHSRHQGILTINYAAVQDGVVLYSDLLKLQLSMKDGRIIGLDARAYLQNHETRNIPSPALTAGEAMARIGEKLTAQSARLCIIPRSGSEYLCYEIAASDGRDDFLVYIDARTGLEIELMQVIYQDNGTLVM